MLSVFQVVCKRFRPALFLSSGMEQGVRTHTHTHTQGTIAGRQTDTTHVQET